MKKTKEILKVGIMAPDDFKNYTMAIAKGEIRRKKDEPKIWFPSIRSLAHVLSEENQRLLRLIAETQPKSIKELEKTTGRKANNLLRTLRTMENYGFVKLVEGKKGPGRAPLQPQLVYNAASIEIHFT